MSPRLPGGVVPRHYAIKLEPDLGEAAFAGSVAIDIDFSEPSSTITLNAAELDIVNARLVTAGNETVELDAVLDAESERLTLSRRGGNDGFGPGPGRLDIAFTGVLNDQLQGFYRSTYTDDSGATRTIATTQFESTDARRAFPCFDEPALKATFATTLVVQEGLLAVSNTAETGRESMPDGRVSVRFATTMPMSTYLVAFVVGPLEVTDPIDCGGVPVRVVHRPGRGDQTGFALDVAAHALKWFSDYYGLPYPSDKLDLVAIPDFAFGAMENLGCVTFREVLLLVDETAASQPELQRVADVINHELAHMWFGDLVTMAWWEGIWLNEAFATFRMLEQYLGAETFRAGVRLYLRRHAYGNTVTEDLWNALAEASGQPVGQIMGGWIYQGGYPSVSATATEHGLEVSQSHFTLDPDRAEPRDWTVPLRLRVQQRGGNRNELRLLLDQPRRILTMPAAPPVTLNAGASGFYRDDPDPASLAAVSQAGPGDRTPDERHGLIDDAWAATLAGRLDAPAFVDLVLGGFTAERDLTVWQAIAGALAHLRRLVDGEAARRFCELVAAASDAAAGDVGLDPPADGGEDERTGELRATLLRLRGAVADHSPAIAACRARLDHPDPTLAAAALGVVAAHGDAGDFARIRGRYTEASDPQTEQRHLAALADFPDAGLVRSILEGTLDNSVRTQDGPYLIRRALTNRHAGPDAWDFLTSRWDDLATTFPSNSLSRMLEGLTALDRVELAAEVRDFMAAHPVPQGAKQVAQHLERLDINVALRERESDRLAAAVLNR
ncbi:MAG: M1 family metallopeptidase [Acidimicrobiaceae bacterium]|nr:M1 family metallopeptidase [Acidimicrobiaceae bacterium]